MSEFFQAALHLVQAFEHELLVSERKFCKIFGSSLTAKTNEQLDKLIKTRKSIGREIK
jgi:hypothetical protein